MIMKWLKSTFEVETEFSKKWMAKFTRIVFVMLIFYIFFSQELILLHFKLGLSRQMCKVFFESYTGVTKVLVTGYAVTFISSMGKAFLSKQQEEKIALEREYLDLNGNGIPDDEEDDESVDIDVEEDDN